MLERLQQHLLRRSLLLTNGLLLTVLASLSLAASAQAEVVRTSIQALDRTFEDLDFGLVPVRPGNVTILVSSPSHRVTVFRNSLTIQTVDGEDAPPGSFDAWLEVELDGEGELVAEVQQTGTVLRDRVTAARQTVKAAARLRLLEAEGGFVLEFVQPYGGTVDFGLQSGLVDQMVTACQGMRFFFDALDCGLLAKSFGVARVPLPAAGTRYWIASEHLDAASLEMMRTLAVPAPSLEAGGP